MLCGLLDLLFTDTPKLASSLVPSDRVCVHALMLCVMLWSILEKLMLQSLQQTCIFCKMHICQLLHLKLDTTV